MQAVMMRVKVIIVEPKYQINLGYIARTATNFGIRRLYLVNPRTSLRGKGARMYAKHGYPLLEGAKVYRSLAAATRDCDILVATSGIWRKGSANHSKVCFAEDAVRKLRSLKKKGGVAGLLIGRDDIGLKSDEIEKCDMLAYISTNPEYPVLNISHALAIMLYLMNREGLREATPELAPRDEALDRREMAKLLEVFDRMVAGRKHIRDKKAVSGAFRRLMRMARPDRRELHAMITALKEQ
jgi:TrmH family RNA methyltransferase